jgi:hypothetical protein
MTDIIDNSDMHHNESKKLHILQDGREEYKGKCLTTDNDYGVYGMDCTYAPIQEWKYTNGNIYTVDEKTSKTKCLYDSKTLYDCDLTIKGKHKNIEDNDIKYPKWHKKFGKNVVLVASDNPWYINKESTVILDHKTPTNKNANYTDFYKPFGTFSKKNLKIIDKPQPSSGVEGFSVISNQSQIVNPYTILLIILLIIITVQIICIMNYN